MVNRHRDHVRMVNQAWTGLSGTMQSGTIHTPSMPARRNGSTPSGTKLASHRSQACFLTTDNESQLVSAGR